MLDRLLHRLNLCAVPLICCAVVGYFAYHAFYGGNGLLAAERLNDRITVLEKSLNAAKEARAKLEKKVALLRPENLDPDILDEFARSFLSKTHQDDIVIMRP